MKKLFQIFRSAHKRRIRQRLDNELLEFSRRISYDTYYKLDDEIFLWLEGPQNIIVAQILGSVK